MRVLPGLEKELGRWRGMGVEYVHPRRGGHPRLRLTVGDRSRFIVYSGTSIDPRGVKNAVSKLRSTLVELGAERG